MSATILIGNLIKDRIRDLDGIATKVNKPVREKYTIRTRVISNVGPLWRPVLIAVVGVLLGPAIMFALAVIDVM